MAKKKTSKKSTAAKKTKSSKATTKSAGKTSKKVAKKVTKKTSKASKSSSASTKKKTTKKTSKKVAKKVTRKTNAGAASRSTTTRKKKTVKPAADEGIIQGPPQLPKTTLKKRDLDYFLKQLMLKRAELIGDVSSMSEEALNVDSANLSHYADHMADAGSDNYEQELTLNLLSSERELLREIDEAIVRIAERTYGMCMVTGKPIGRPRLEAKPWAKYSIEAAREMERNGQGQF